MTVGPGSPQQHRAVRAIAMAAVAAVIVAVALALDGSDGTRRLDTGRRPSTVTPTTASPSTTTTSTTARPSTTTTTTATTTTTTTASTSRPPVEGRVISRGDPSRRLVSFTFDAGSDPDDAGPILDILSATGIRATFGITGRFAELFPAVVRRIAAEGHDLVNHSYDHPSFTGRSTGTSPLTAAQRTDQLQRAEAVIVAATKGKGTAGWFRPPYGDIDDSVVRDVAAAGWPTILMCTVDSLGWKGIGADAVAQRCLERAEPGAIYLFHVGGASDDAEALQRIIDGLRADGYGFRTTAELGG